MGRAGEHSVDIPIKYGVKDNYRDRDDSPNNNQR